MCLKCRFRKFSDQVGIDEDVNDNYQIQKLILITSE